MRRAGKVLFSLLMIAFVAGLAGTANAQRIEERYSTITVVGEATASAAPDKATVRFGVVTRDDDPEEARRLNAEAAREAMNAVREIIQDDARIRLESLRLQPAREWEPEERRYVDLGFEAVRDVVVDVRNLDQLPTVVARVVQAGANRLHGVTYELQDQDEVRNLALERALENATEKATLMTAALGTDLGRVLRITEHGSTMPVPLMRGAMMESYAVAKDAAPEPEAYAPGEIEVRATVEVVFAIRSGDGE